jgi:hypothetical protein
LTFGQTITSLWVNKKTSSNMPERAKLAASTLAASTLAASTLAASTLADVNYWTLRFPRIPKIHDDRTWKDAVSFVELQESAHERQHLATENVDQGKKLWLARLQDSDQSVQQADGITSQETSG